MKQVSFNKEFSVERSGTEYRDLIHNTSKLIGRSYVVTFKLVEKFEPSQVLFLYENCVANWRKKGFNSPAMMWWTERKKLSTPTH